VEDAVDVQENGCHGARVYSGHAVVSIPLSEIDFRYSRSSGPGGQHAQKSETRVEALFDVEASSALTDRQKHRVVRKAGPVLRAIAPGRAQPGAKHRELAVERIADALREAPPRRAPPRAHEASKAAVERRLEQKRRRSETKRLRQRPD
jgi:ribosome-associated protein